jgi:hypothetical protein
MRNKLTYFLIVLVIILSVSCESKPATTAVEINNDMEINNIEQVQPGLVRIPEPAEQDESFDPRTVSQTQYAETREEVQHFIEGLNRIIGNKNYSAWRSALSNEYFRRISSPENLRQMSEQPALKTKNIVLRTPQDYFNNVVVPSRANSRVDDIEFIGRNRVKAFTVNKNRAGEEQRLVLYDLEKVGNSWIIIN